MPFLSFLKNLDLIPSNIIWILGQVFVTKFHSFHWYKIKNITCKPLTFLMRYYFPQVQKVICPCVLDCQLVEYFVTELVEYFQLSKLKYIITYMLLIFLFYFSIMSIFTYSSFKSNKFVSLLHSSFVSRSHLIKLSKVPAIIPVSNQFL